MSTYNNTYQMLKRVRYGLNEYDVYDDNYTEGLDVSGGFSNEYIMYNLNKAQDYIWNTVIRKEKGIFLKQSTITGVNSVYALPADFGYVAEFRNDNGYKVHRVNPIDFANKAVVGSDTLYYRKYNSFVLDRSGVTKDYSLWYYYKPRQLDQGACVSGTATSIKFASSARKINDYYNDMLMENITSDWTGTISDYNTDRVATVTNSSNDGDYYGLVSDLPEVFHEFIVTRAVLTIKAEAPQAFDAPTKREKDMFTESLIEALIAYAGYPGDVPIEDQVTDFEPNVLGPNIIYD